MKDASSKALYSNNKFAVHSSEPERARKLITGEFFEEYSKTLILAYMSRMMCAFLQFLEDTFL